MLCIRLTSRLECHQGGDSAVLLDGETVRCDDEFKRGSGIQVHQGHEVLFQRSGLHLQPHCLRRYCSCVHEGIVNAAVCSHARACCVVGINGMELDWIPGKRPIWVEERSSPAVSIMKRDVSFN